MQFLYNIENLKLSYYHLFFSFIYYHFWNAPQVSQNKDPYVYVMLTLPLISTKLTSLTLYVLNFSEGT